MGLRGISLGALAVALVSCNEAEDAKPTPQSIAKCETYVAAWCDRQAACFQWTADQSAQCRTTTSQMVDCATAVAATENYDNCLSAIAASACAASAAAAQQPASCANIIVHAP